MGTPVDQQIGTMVPKITLTSDIEVRLIQAMGGDHMVVAAAKVSTCGDDALRWALEEFRDDNFGLINFLMKHRHGTPFEHGSVTVFTRCPIFVYREWHRHRVGFSYNEESARYKPLEPVFWVPRRDRPMIPVEGWKPGRPKFRTLDEATADYFLERPNPGCGYKKWADSWYRREIDRDRESYEVAYRNYLGSIQDGFALEVARSKLPVAIYSSCWVTCNPRSLMAFLSLRTHDESATYVSYPQLEIEEAARMTEDILKEHWPLTHKAFVQNGRVGP